MILPLSAAFWYWDLQEGYQGKIIDKKNNKMSVSVKTEGIVLHSFKYGDTSIISRIYTKELGLQSYLVAGVRKRKTSFKYGLFQPLSMFEMIVYHNKKHGLQRIKEISSVKQYKNVHSDIRKTTIAIFISEVLVNCLKEEESNHRLFDFLKNSFLFLDNATGKIAHFHLLFLFRLTRYLGFYPNLKKDVGKPVFNLKEGVYQEFQKDSPYFLDLQFSEFFNKLSNMEYKDLSDFSIPLQLRKPLLEKIIAYYKLHMEGFRDLKSLPVLEELFN